MASAGHEQTHSIVIDLLEKDITEYTEKELITYELAIREKISEAMNHYAKVRVHLKMLKNQKKKEENKRLRAEKMQRNGRDACQVDDREFRFEWHTLLLQPLTSAVKDMRQEFHVWPTSKSRRL